MSGAALPPIPNFSTTSPATNAATYLTTPTYDSSGQAMHPGIVDYGSSLSGYRYWMSMTPYTGGHPDVENPSVLASNDKETWVVPDGLTNPVVPAVTFPAYNSDPDLIKGQDGKLYLYYRYTNGVDADTCFVRSSTDGITWSDPTALFTTGYTLWGCPAVIWDGSQYVMFSQEGATGAGYITKRTCATPDGTWSSPTTCLLTGAPAGLDVWHFDVIKTGHIYQMFLQFCDHLTSGENGALYFAQSINGYQWLIESSPFLSKGSGGAWDDGGIYRATGLAVDGGIDLLYSAYSGSVWHTGRTTVTLT